MYDIRDVIEIVTPGFSMFCNPLKMRNPYDHGSLP